MIVLRFLACTGIAIFTVASSLAGTLVIGPVADTAILSLTPDNNFGAEPALPLGALSQAGQKGRVLLRFNLESIPSGSVVNRVTLDFTVLKARGAGTPVPVELHRLLTPWNEGSKVGSQGQAAFRGESTWSAAILGQTAWGVPGGLSGVDFVATASASVGIVVVGPAQFGSTDQLVADAQFWVDHPGSNQGWIWNSGTETEPATALRVAAREDAARAPRLTVEFSPPAVRIPIDGVRLVSGGLEIQFQALAGNIYTVSAADRIDPPLWSPVTNLVAKLISFPAAPVLPMGSSARFFKVEITGTVD